MKPAAMQSARQHQPAQPIPGQVDPGHDTLCGTPQQRYCDFACMQLRTVIVVHYGTVMCDRSCERIARAA